MTGENMTKVKKMLKSISEHYKPVMNRYPATMILIVLLAALTSVFIDQSGTFAKFVEEKGLLFVFLWVVGAYFVESFLPEGKIRRLCCLTAAGIAAAAFVYFGNYGSDLRQATAGHWTTAWCFILIPLGIYRNYRGSGLPFNEYCIRTVHELARLAITCFIMGIGIALVVSVFVALILNGSHYMLIIRAEFLVLGILAGSGILYALIRSDRELPRFFTVIVKSVLLSLLLIAFAIIYVYILKIVITRVVPSNEIFRILAGLFIIGLPIWTLIGTFEENTLPIRIGVRLPYIFIPFLFLQGYAIRERIAAYGITPLRYLCIVLMIFECIYIAVYFFRKRETGIMLPVIAVLAAISLVIPFTNMYSTANRSQKAIFDRFISTDFSGLAAEDQSSLAGAYYYLSGNPEGKALLADVDPGRIEAIRESGKTGDPDFDSYIYIMYQFPVKNFDISGYDRMTAVSTFSPLADEKPEQYEPENVEFFDTEGNSILTADLTGTINACIAANAENNSTVPGFEGVIRIDDHSLIRASEFVMTMKPDRTISFLSVNGILLTDGTDK